MCPTSTASINPGGGYFGRACQPIPRPTVAHSRRVVGPVAPSRLRTGRSRASARTTWLWVKSDAFPVGSARYPGQPIPACPGRNDQGVTVSGDPPVPFRCAQEPQPWPLHTAEPPARQPYIDGFAGFNTPGGAGVPGTVLANSPDA